MKDDRLPDRAPLAPPTNERSSPTSLLVTESPSPMPASDSALASGSLSLCKASRFPLSSASKYSCESTDCILSLEMAEVGGAINLLALVSATSEENSETTESMSRSNAFP